VAAEPGTAETAETAETGNWSPVDQAPRNSLIFHRRNPASLLPLPDATKRDEALG
jgi:hypothetical protein